MKTESCGLYLHIPFCVRKCAYCDFCSFKVSDFEYRDEYIRKMCEEIRSYKDKNIKVDTVFFGGGTPSLLTLSEIRLIMSSVRESFILSDGFEFTIEANPKTLSLERLNEFRKAGVNRVSIGLQSIHENELLSLGRIHNFDDFLESYRLVREVGIENVNVDLMYGIPYQTKESFEKTIDTVLSLCPEHISAYGLIIEEGTPISHSPLLEYLPSEDEECDMYSMLCEKLKSRGYLHYEISNYAKEGKGARHNLKYWRDLEYIGIGLSAYSYFEGARYENPSFVGDYLRMDFSKREYHPLSENEKSYEYAMLALRLSEGLDLSEYSRLFKKDFIEGKTAMIDRLISAGLVVIESGRLSLSEKGFYVSNSILTELL